LTERNSYLASLANEYKFRDVFFDPPGIISRYSGLIHFSLFLTAVRGVEPVQVLNSINEVRDACRPAVRAEKNLALALASFSGSGGTEGAPPADFADRAGTVLFCVLHCPFDWGQHEQ
jgi:hypothetical protein